MNEQIKTARLGRGLSALLGDYSGAQNAMNDPGAAEDVDAGEEIGPASELAIDMVSPNPRQPRRTFDSPEGCDPADSGSDRP